jgi:asparagine synthase (glutamine-hydrolysing)
MCGIGYIHTNNLQTVDIGSAISHMANTLHYRGPDATQTYIDNSYGLAFNRLAIVGGEDGMQPIFNSDKSIALICNGEIFNNLQLKSNEAKTINFATSSDVEVILHLYSKYGVNFLNKLEGQFAFVLVDKNEGKTMIARDKFGINPLYYYISPGYFIVSSEIKSLLATKLIPDLNFNIKGLAETAVFYGPTPPYTCFEGVMQLPPGYFGIYDHRKHTLSTDQYWSYDSSDIGVKSNLINAIESSVTKRLQGDSIPGVYLSGGLDSSLIGYLTAKYSKKKPVLFSISFPDKDYDESHYQKLVADYFDLSLKTLSIKWDDVVNNLTSTIKHCETPLLRTAAVPMYLLSKLVHAQGIKFVLCGEGADELFAGYPVFSNNLCSFQDKWEQNYKILQYLKDNTSIEAIVSEYNNLIKHIDSRDLHNLLEYEIKTKLSRYLLTNQGDRVSMAHGVEQRFPFLDSEVVKISRSFKTGELIKHGQGKKILKDLFADCIPTDIIRRKKQGYLAPDKNIVEHLLNDQEVKALLSKQYIESTGVFEYSKVSNLLKELKLGRRTDTSNIQSFLFILSTQILYKTFIAEKW